MSTNPVGEGADARRALREIDAVVDERIRRILRGVLERQVRYAERMTRIEQELAALRHLLERHLPRVREVAPPRGAGRHPE